MRLTRRSATSSRRRAFETNRTGLVRAAPAAAGRAPLTVTHPGGAAEADPLPAQRSARTSPCSTSRGSRWQLRRTRRRRAVRAGDVFEMEDQRNWSDASFKTYSRPLALPFPYRGGRRRARAPADRRSRVDEKSPPAAVPRAAAADRIALRRGGAFPADPRRRLDRARSRRRAPSPVGQRRGGRARPRLVELACGARPRDRERAAARRACDPRRGTPTSARSTISPAALRDLPLLRVAAFDPVLHVTDAAAAARAALGARGGRYRRARHRRRAVALHRVQPRARSASPAISTASSSPRRRSSTRSAPSSSSSRSRCSA